MGEDKLTKKVKAKLKQKEMMAKAIARGTHRVNKMPKVYATERKIRKKLKI